MFLTDVEQSKNYCDHDKKEFKFYSRNNWAKNPPMPIQLAILNAKKWAHGGTNFMSALKTVRISDRRIRSQRREAIASVVQCLVSHTELITNRAIKITGNNVKSSLNIGLISAMTNMHSKRVNRAIDDLHMGGYLKIRRQIRRPRNGNWRRNLHIESIEDSLFVALGVSVEVLNQTRKYIKNKIDAAIKKTVDKAGRRKISNIMNAAMKKKSKVSTIQLSAKKPSGSPTKSISGFLSKYNSRFNT